jgi:hypothetical protein
VVLRDPAGKGPNLSFQARDRRPARRSWLHLDLYTTDQAAEVERPGYVSRGYACASSRNSVESTQNFLNGQLSTRRVACPVEAARVTKNGLLNELAPCSG